MLTLPDGPHKGFVGDEPEYECFNAFGPMIGSKDVSAAIYLSNIVDRLGMDVNETSWALGLAMECYDKQILTSKDTDGVNLSWGNVEAVDQMMRRIATRQGFGDILAEGTMRAAKKIGGDAPNFAIHTMKGNTPRGHDDRNRWQKLLDTCIGQMGTDEGYAFAGPANLGINIKVTTGYNTSPEEALAMNIQCRGGQQFEDCLGVCRATVRTDVALLAKGVAIATGWDFTPQEGLDAGRRIVNLLRAFNMRCGHTAEMDAPSPRYGSTPTDGPSAGKSFMNYFYDLRGRYYEGMGWDKTTGKPLPETLKKYGLEYAIPELWGK
jgi:aldehyde:ferredoxin oxidoreductase